MIKRPDLKALNAEQLADILYKVYSETTNASVKKRIERRVVPHIQKGLSNHIHNSKVRRQFQAYGVK